MKETKRPERSDRDILNGSPVIVEFNGVEYKWTQSPRREQARIREELGEVLCVLSVIDGEVTIGAGMAALKAVNAILAFCEDNHEGMRGDIDDIEDYIKANGLDAMAELITDVYTPLFNEWLKPWLEGSGKAKKKTRNTLNRKSTKS